MGSRTVEQKIVTAAKTNGVESLAKEAKQVEAKQVGELTGEVEVENVEQDEDEFILVPESAFFDAKELGEKLKIVEVRWNRNGPEKLRGKVACEATLITRSGTNKLQLVVSENVKVSRDVLKAFAIAYGIDGHIDVQMVRSEDVSDLGTMKF